MRQQLETATRTNTMKKIFVLLSLLAVAATSALAQPHKVKWKHESRNKAEVYHSEKIKGDFLAKTTFKGKPILTEGKAFEISVTTTSNTNTPFDGFANGYGTGILSTIDPYAHPDSQKEDKQFGIYVGNNKSGLDGYLDHRMAQLRINGQVYSVSNYELNHINDGFRSTLTLSFTMKYTPAKGERKSQIVFTANKNSDVTFDPLTIEDITTSVLFENLQNGGTVSTPPGTRTNLSITVEGERKPFITTGHYVLGGLCAAALIVLCLAFSSGRKKKTTEEEY